MIFNKIDLIIIWKIIQTQLIISISMITACTVNNYCKKLITLIDDCDHIWNEKQKILEESNQSLFYKQL